MENRVSSSGAGTLEVELIELSDKDPAVLIGEGLREAGKRRGARTRHPLESVMKAFRKHLGTPRGDRFSRGVAACLTDDDPRVRAQALLFFEAFPEAAGAELLVTLARSRRTLFAGVPNPFAPSLDLEWQLLRSIGARILRRDRDALAFGYSCAVEPGHAQPIIAALTFTDPDWVVAHAEAIVSANPGVAGTLLNSLQRSAHDVGAVGARIAPLAARDPKFQETLELLILEEGTRRRIFDAMH